jgi:hypothetical protein
VARTSSVVQAIQLGENSEEGGVVLAGCRIWGISSDGMSWMPTLNNGRRRSGGILSTGRRERSDVGTEERMERS